MSAERIAVVGTERGASEPGPSTLGGLLLAFSTVTSAGLGLGADHGIRTCYIGMCLAPELELGPRLTADVYYAALAKDGGCACGTSHMAAFLGADEQVAIADLARLDTSNELAMLRWLFRHAGRGGGPATRARRTIGALIHGARFERDVSQSECEVAQRVATRLGLGDEVALALTACTERWDGKGHPRGVAGEAIPQVARIVNLAAAIEVAHRFSGRDAAVTLARRGAGKAFDPAVAGAFLDLARSGDVWAGLDDEAGLTARVLALEPVDERRPGGADAVDRFTEVLADLVDLKRPATAGHARRVATRAQRIGERLGLAGRELVALRRAALIHDVGLLALSARSLAVGAEGAAYHAHPLAAAQLLASVPELRGVCALTALHHERLDGSGWPAGVAAVGQSPAARVLAMVCACDELSGGEPEAEAVALRTLATQSGFDRAALDALAAELGASRPAPRERPAGLTEREVEVLQLAAAGLTVREIGRRLVISPHTARHHLERTYAKTGCSTRAAAALYAAEHGLLD